MENAKNRKFKCNPVQNHKKSQPAENGEKNQIAEKNKRNQKDIKQRRKNVREELLADTLRIPTDVCDGSFRVTLTGNSRVWVENYRGILEYTDCHILLQGKNGRICFEGSGLCIDYYTGDDMLIRGRIKRVLYDG